MPNLLHLALDRLHGRLSLLQIEGGFPHGVLCFYRLTMTSPNNQLGLACRLQGVMALWLATRAHLQLFAKP